jgi:hypothetical protein
MEIQKAKRFALWESGNQLSQGPEKSKKYPGNSNSYSNLSVNYLTQTMEKSGPEGGLVTIR